MKKILALLLTGIFVLVLAGCHQTVSIIPATDGHNMSMNDIIANEPSITGIVKDVGENAILIETDNGEYWVSRNVENKDSVTDFVVGDEVVVYFDGNVAESYPMQISTVYAITLKTPADRTENDKS